MYSISAAWKFRADFLCSKWLKASPDCWGHSRWIDIAYRSFDLIKTKTVHSFTGGFCGLKNYAINPHKDSKLPDVCVFIHTCYQTVWWRKLTNTINSTRQRWRKRHPLILLPEEKSQVFIAMITPVCHNQKKLCQSLQVNGRTGGFPWKVPQVTGPSPNSSAHHSTVAGF